MTFDFWADRTDKRVRYTEFNNFALANKNFLLEGCEVTAAGTDMDVDVSAGKIFINGDIVDVSAGSITLIASDPSDDRYDVIAINSSGTIIKVDGTPSTPPATPNYTETDYVVIAGVIVQDGVTTIASADVQNISIEGKAFSKVNRGTSDPATGNIGELFYNTGDTVLKFYTGTQWEEVGTGSGGGISKVTKTFTSETSVNFQHDLNDLNPIVQVYDINNEQMLPNKIDIVDGNNVLVEFGSPQTGFILVAGGAETIRIGATAYYSAAFSASTLVNVPHALGLKYVQVQCFDSNDEMIEPQKVELIDDDNLQVTFGSAVTGKVVVSGGTTNASVFGIKRFSDSFTSETSYIVNHNLNTTTPNMTVFNSSGEVIFPDITINDANSLTLEFGSAETGSIEVQGGIQSTSPGAGSGDFLPDTDDAYDLGSGSFQWKDGYFSGDVAADNVTATTFAGDGSNLTDVDADTLEGYSTGTGANNIVKLDGSSKLPAVDGSNLTGIGGGSELGNIIMHNPTVSGAKSISDMQDLGFAVCDGTTPASQGITSPDITTTPNMSGRFPYGHATTAETTGGAGSHTHPASSPSYPGSSGSLGLWGSASNIPPYMTVVFMMKVKE